MTAAPVALFAFNRPEHVRRTLESLSRNVGANQAELVVFLDGPRHERDEAQVRAVREVVTSRHWCKSVDIVVRGENWGCAIHHRRRHAAVPECGAGDRRRRRSGSVPLVSGIHAHGPPALCRCGTGHTGFWVHVP